MKDFFKQIIGLILLVTFSANCGCVTLFSSVNFKNAPRSSFVKIEVITEEYSATGSGVIINHIENTNTIILTAGHLCHDNTVAMRVLDLSEKPYEIIGFIRAPKDDLCLLVTKETIDGKAIKVSDQAPSIGDHVYNIAAPMGIHGPNMELMFDGYYQGKLKIPEDHYPSDVYTIAGKGGSSGSPVFNENWEIIGIVSRGLPSFQHLMLTVEQTRIKDFYDYSLTKQFRIDVAKNIIGKKT